MEIREDSRLSPDGQGRSYPLQKANVEEDIILEGEQRPHQVSQDIERSSASNAGFGNREGNRQPGVSKRERRPHQASHSIERNTRTDKANEVKDSRRKNWKVEESNYDPASKKFIRRFFDNVSEVGKEAP